MEHTRLRVWVLGLAMMALPVATIAAPPPELPRENHYKVYREGKPPITITKPLLLRDQFGTYNVDILTLERWSNPAEKIHNGISYPPVDPVVHQMWWRGNFPPIPPTTIIGIDQFGFNKWTLIIPEYLLTPALKNEPTGNPPVWNHYLCYRAQPGPMPQVVTLIDQFGTADAQLVSISWFCNPVEKRHLDDGLFYPIVDGKAHLACYQIFTPDPMIHPITSIDQFGHWQFEVLQPDCLCVPALKEHVVGTESSTWGKIKAMYR
jgi:hypothetical protein